MTVPWPYRDRARHPHLMLRFGWAGVSMSNWLLGGFLGKLMDPVLVGAVQVRQFGPGISLCSIA